MTSSDPDSTEPAQPPAPRPEESPDVEPSTDPFPAEPLSPDRQGGPRRIRAQGGQPKWGPATGRRKRAVARVWLTAGTGKVVINGRDAATYFPGESHQALLSHPFVVTDTVGYFDVVATAEGGGTRGQVDAVVLGIARALQEVDHDYRSSLKEQGLLRRDPRIKESKKYGLKKARKAPQYSKR